jgi:hypothetical protein
MPYGTRIQEMPNIPSVRKSNYTMPDCFVCNSPIKRGQLITQCMDGIGGHYCIILRERSTHPGQMDAPFYRPTTAGRWVHQDCRAPYVWTEHTYKTQMKEDQSEASGDEGGSNCMIQ